MGTDALNSILETLKTASEIAGIMMRHGDTEGSCLAVIQLVEQARLELTRLNKNYDFTKKVELL